MRGNILRKIIVALVVILPVFTYADCKKQVKCGCGTDVLRTLVNESAQIFWETSGSISFRIVGDIYSSYSFCNPSEMYTHLSDAKSGDILQVSGAVYWNCQYVYQASNSSYRSPYASYDVQGTDLFIDLYGKDKKAPEKIDSPKPTF